MSGVKRYRFKGAAGEYVYAGDYDAALARETALREELATANKTIASMLKNGWVERDNLKILLTAAEQRNAELVALLTGLPSELQELSGCENTAGVLACIDHVEYLIRSLTKPTESGASE